MSSTPYEPPASGFRTFLTVWATQSVSVIGMALTFFALTVYLTQTIYPAPEQQAQLALALTAWSLSFALPQVILAPIAGAYADRHDRRRIMMAADAGNGLLSALLVALMLRGDLAWWMMIAVGIASASLSTFHGAAFDASYFMLVPAKQLPRANGMMQTMWSLSGILAPALAAFLIALPSMARQGTIGGWLGSALARFSDGAPFAIGLDALTFFLASFVLLFLFIPSPKRTDLEMPGPAGHAAADGSPSDGAPAPAPSERPKRKSIWADVREGALFIFRRRPLVWLLGAFAVANLFLSPLSVLQPMIVKFQLAADWTARGFTYETALAVVSSAFALGGVAGGVFISAWGGLKRRRVVAVLIPLVSGGALIAVYGLSPYLYLTGAAGFAIAAGFPIANAHSQAIWQTQTPAEMQGRVFSVRRVIASFTTPIGAALAGSLAALVGASAVIAVAGILLTVFTLAQFLNPHLLRVEDKDWLDRMARKAGEIEPMAGEEVSAGD